MTKLHRVFAALLAAPALTVPSAGAFAQLSAKDRPLRPLRA